MESVPSLDADRRPGGAPRVNQLFRVGAPRTTLEELRSCQSHRTIHNAHSAACIWSARPFLKAGLDPFVSPRSQACKANVPNTRLWGMAEVERINNVQATIVVWLCVLLLCSTCGRIVSRIAENAGLPHGFSSAQKKRNKPSLSHQPYPKPNVLTD